VAWESGGGAWHRPASRPQKPDRHAKTIVFCEDINHTARIRQALANANADICATQPKYVVQITGDNPEGPRKRDNFMGRGTRLLQEKQFNRKVEINAQLRDILLEVDDLLRT